ncbi:MAG: HipA family kinase [Enterovibrio sp.]
MMIEIINIGSKIAQGITGPYLCTGNDGNKYVVKGPNTTYRGLITEWVCAQLGKEIGLPIPDFTTAYIESLLLQYDKYDLEEGEWFASKYEKNIQDMPYSMLDKMNVTFLKLLFIFDYWVRNGDRNLTKNGGNPNLFIRADLKSFIVLDHNLAFDQSISFVDDFKELHICSELWFRSQRSLFEPNPREYYTELLAKCFNKLDSIFDSIPKEWIERCSDDNIINTIRVTLSKFNDDEFWEAIE